MKKVGIVIVNYNGARYQNECIRSLYNMTYRDFEIIIVDSASKDNSIQLVEEEFPSVHILKQNENVGVAKGNNIGIEYSRELGTEYTLLMNNDVILDTKTLEKLLDKADRNRVTVPKIYYYDPDDMIWFAGGEFDFEKGKIQHTGMREKEQDLYNEDRIIEYAPTCCMLIHNGVFDTIGMMDEKYFMYYDDVDFCLRMKKGGIELFYVHDAIMWHKVSSSAGGENSALSIYYNTRNHLYYIDKFPEYMKMKTMVYSLAKDIARYIMSPIRNKRQKYILPAISDYKKGKMGRRDDLVK